MIGPEAAFVLRWFNCHKRVDAVIIERNESLLLNSHDSSSAIGAVRAIASYYFFLVFLDFHECSAGCCILWLRTGC